jgi:hypothetical protein
MLSLGVIKGPRGAATPDEEGREDVGLLLWVYMHSEGVLPSFQGARDMGHEHMRYQGI